MFNAKKYNISIKSGQDEQSSVREDRPEIRFGAKVYNHPLQDDKKLEDSFMRFYAHNGDSFNFTRSMASKHLLMLGGIGTGKTNVFFAIIKEILEQMLEPEGKDDIAILFDTKGDMKREFYDENNPNHILIGNSEEYYNISYRWNIYKELLDTNGKLTRTSEITAKEIAKQLFAGRESESQPFFTEAAAALVAIVIRNFKRNACYIKNETFLPRAMINDLKSRPQAIYKSLIRDDITDVPEAYGYDSFLNNEKLVNAFLSSGIGDYSKILKDPDNRDFANAQSYIGESGDKMTAQALGVLGTINSMIDDLFVGIFGEKGRKDSEGNIRDFSMRQLVRERGGKVIFIEYDLTLGEVLGPIYSLLIDLALKEALGRNSSTKGNVYLVLDEFKLLPNLKHIDDALNFGRSLGVKVFAGLQSISQIYDIYGEERGKAMLSGFINSFCFQTTDAESREFISERYGKNYQSYTYRSNGEPVTIQREGYAVEDWDILNLKVGEAFVRLAGEELFRFHFTEYESDKK